MAKTKEAKTLILKPKTNNQSNYIQSMAEHDVTFCTGPAGTGKTAVALGLACEYLKDGKVENIKIVRPAVETSEGGGLGYLPGELDKKLDPYFVNMKEELVKYLGRSLLVTYIAEGIIEIAPLEYMRGRNFHCSFAILDEAQNASFKQIKMFITRMGKNTKMVINGDTDQTDLHNSGLPYCIERLSGLENVGIIQLTYEDIIRNKKLAIILARLENDGTQT